MDYVLTHFMAVCDSFLSCVSLVVSSQPQCLSVSSHSFSCIVKSRLLLSCLCHILQCACLWLPTCLSVLVWLIRTHCSDKAQSIGPFINNKNGAREKVGSGHSFLANLLSSSSNHNLPHSSLAHHLLAVKLSLSFTLFLSRSTSWMFFILGLLRLTIYFLQGCTHQSLLYFSQ